MKLSDFDFFLPPSQIALYPPAKRSQAKLLHIPLGGGAFGHYLFKDVRRFFRPGDVLVLNNTKVIPARLFARRKTGGKVEIFLLKKISPQQWTALVRPSGRVRSGEKVLLEKSKIEVLIEDSVKGTAQRTIRFQKKMDLQSLSRLGHMPLPPYIRRPDEPSDKKNYQTVFAQKDGAVAAPTAGLHFDRPLLEKLRRHGVEIVLITLHVGYGTFKTIKDEDLKDHVMDEEIFEINAAAAKKINRAIHEKRRIIACGTTVVRALESAATQQGEVKAGKRGTKLFIYPPYPFKIVRGLITNFHLPKSTLLMLVAAFLGNLQRLQEAYKTALETGYRFYSYGDAMILTEKEPDHAEDK